MVPLELHQECLVFFLKAPEPRYTYYTYSAPLNIWDSVGEMEKNAEATINSQQEIKQN